ncbi:Glutelin type-a, partial [Thalictrum thalictroides]
IWCSAAMQESNWSPHNWILHSGQSCNDMVDKFYKPQPQKEQKQSHSPQLARRKLGTVADHWDSNGCNGGLLAKTIQTVTEGEGGSYYTWLSTDFPILSDTKLGAGKLLLQPLGLALPHYADSAKIGYVTDGTGLVGILLSGSSEERVLKLKKGDMLPVPLGAISWWFNDGNTDFSLVFLGDTSKAHNPGNFTYFFLTGAIGILNGFSSEFLVTAFGLSEEETTKITTSQPGAVIVKLDDQQQMPEPNKNGNEHMVYNTEIARPDVDVKNGGQLLVVSPKEFDLLGEVGLSGAVVKLEKNAMYAPEYSSSSAFQVNYIVKGSGRVQIVGFNGQNVLNETVKSGDLFVVPRFFVVSVIAGEEGMDWFSIFTMQKPVFSQLAGNTSAWKALSPKVVQAALNITPELEERFRSKMSMNATFFPPSN